MIRIRTDLLRARVAILPRLEPGRRVFFTGGMDRSASSAIPIIQPKEKTTLPMPDVADDARRTRAQSVLIRVIRPIRCWVLPLPLPLPLPLANPGQSGPRVAPSPLLDTPNSDGLT